MPAGRLPLLIALFAASWLAIAAGCGGLPAYDDVRAALPADEFAELAGQWVHYERAGSGEPLILIHGFGESTYTWRQVMPALAENYDVIAIDLNGFGYTERPVDASNYTLPGQAGLVFRLLDHLGINDAHVVGHSYGTAVAIEMVTEQPERVRTLVLVDGAPGDDTGSEAAPLMLVEPFFRCYVEHVLLTADQIRGLLEGAAEQDAFVTDEVVDQYLRRLRVEGLDRTIAGFLTFIRAEPIRPDFTMIEQPTLIVWGQHDPVFPLDWGSRLADTMPNAELSVLASSGHLPMEEEPENFTAAIAAFLARNGR